MAKNKKLFTKGQLVFIILGFLIVATTVFVYISFPKKDISQVGTKNAVVEAIPQYKKTTLDERFLVLYGKILSVDENSIKVSTIIDAQYTDSTFNSIPEVKASLNNDTKVIKYDVDTQASSSINILDIKVGDYATIYLKNNISEVSIHSAVGITVFSRAL